MNVNDEPLFCDPGWQIVRVGDEPIIGLEPFEDGSGTRISIICPGWELTHPDGGRICLGHDDVTDTFLQTNLIAFTTHDVGVTEAQVLDGYVLIGGFNLRDLQEISVRARKPSGDGRFGVAVDPDSPVDPVGLVRQIAAFLWKRLW